MSSIVACMDCGKLVTGRLGVSKRCQDCHFALKAARAVADEQQTLNNKRASRRNWYYNNRGHAQAKHRDWLANNKEKVKQYEEEHADQRRLYVETRRARLLEADDGTLTARLWMIMLQMYERQCAYCMETFEYLEQDHVVPLSKGGKHTISNVVPACLECNRAKSTRLVEPIHPLYKHIKEEFSNG